MDRWITVRSKGEDKGVAMIIQPTPAFYQQESTQAAGKRTFAFAWLFQAIQILFRTDYLRVDCRLRFAANLSLLDTSDC